MTFNPGPASRRLTPEGYLAAEELAEVPSEYHDGEVFAMVGARFEHNTIAANIHGSLFQQLRGKPCRVLSTSMKVRVEDDNAFLYPDVLAYCGQPRFFDHNRTALLNPAVIIEVLSDSTEAYDRAGKFDLYKKVVGLDDYLLVHQYEPRIDHFRRQTDGDWLLHTAAGLGATLALPAIACGLPLHEVYEGVEFPAPLLPPRS